MLDALTESRQSLDVEEYGRCLPGFRVLTTARCGEPVLHGSELDQAIEGGLAGDEPITNERIMEKLEQLFHLGYVWLAGEYAYEPGIPSLMTYVNNQLRSEHRN